MEGRICVTNREMETRVLTGVFEEGQCENRAQGKRDLSVAEAPRKMGRGEGIPRAGGQGPLPLRRQGRAKAYAWVLPGLLCRR